MICPQAMSVDASTGGFVTLNSELEELNIGAEVLVTGVDELKCGTVLVNIGSFRLAVYGYGKLAFGLGW